MKRNDSGIKYYIIVLVVCFAILFVSTLGIKNITVLGCENIDSSYIISEIFESNLDYISILFYLKDKFVKHKEINYIEKYQIEWQNPISVEVIVYEKPIVGYIRYMSSNFYFDKDGYVRKISLTKDYNVPEFFGMSYNDLVLNKQITVKDKNIFNSILNITDNIAKYNININLVEYNSTKDINLYIDKIKILLGTNENMEIKFMVLNDIYPKIKDMSGTLDLRKARENMLDEQYIFTQSN